MGFELFTIDFMVRSFFYLAICEIYTNNPENDRCLFKFVYDDTEGYKRKELQILYLKIN